MNKVLNKLRSMSLAVSTAVMLLPVTVSASNASSSSASKSSSTYTTGKTPDFENVTQPIVDLINNLLNPAIALVGALGMVYCVILGAKFAKAEEPQEREKAKAHLKNAIIGFVLIFVLMVVLKGTIKPLTTWATGK